MTCIAVFRGVCLIMIVFMPLGPVALDFILSIKITVSGSLIGAIKGVFLSNLLKFIV